MNCFRKLVQNIHLNSLQKKKQNTNIHLNFRPKIGSDLKSRTSLNSVHRPRVLKTMDNVRLHGDPQPGVVAQSRHFGKLLFSCRAFEYKKLIFFRFRWDYFDIYKRRTKGKELEWFKRFAAGGVSTEYLESVYPAESFPAWQTIQTGRKSSK